MEAGERFKVQRFRLEKGDTSTKKKKWILRVIEMPRHEQEHEILTTE